MAFRALANSALPATSSSRHLQRSKGVRAQENCVRTESKHVRSAHVLGTSATYQDCQVLSIGNCKVETMLAKCFAAMVMCVAHSKQIFAKHSSNNMRWC